MAGPLQIKAVLDRFEGHKGVLLFDDVDLLGPLAGQELVLPKRLLPAGLKTGDVVAIELMTDDEATLAREALARSVLEDILNGK